MEIVYCLPKYLSVKRVVSYAIFKQFQPTALFFTRRSDSSSIFIYDSQWSVLKLSSFPLLFRKMIEPESKGHASTFQTHPVGSLTYYKPEIRTILQLPLLGGYLEIMQYSTPSGNICRTRGSPYASRRFCCKLIPKLQKEHKSVCLWTEPVILL